MTKYQKSRVRIWMTQVRRKGSKRGWSVTGRDYFSSFADAVRGRHEAEENWPELEYRTVEYLPEKPNV